MRGFQLKLFGDDGVNNALQFKAIQVIFCRADGWNSNQDATAETGEKTRGLTDTTVTHAADSSNKRYLSFILPRISTIIPSRSASALARSLTNRSRLYGRAGGRSALFCFVVGGGGDATLGG